MKPSINYPGRGRLRVGSVGRPLPALGTSLRWAVKQEAVQTWPETYGITCGNILRRSGPGSVRQAAGVGALPSTASICVPNTFFLFQDM